MYNKQILRAALNERLSETAEEIFLLFEQATAEYQREIDRLRTVIGARGTEVFPSTSSEITPQTLITLGRDELTGYVLDGENIAYFPCKVKTEPWMSALEYEPQLQISNVMSLNHEDELQPYGQQSMVYGDGPERLGGVSEEEEIINLEQLMMSREEDPNTSNNTSKKAFICPVCQKCFPQIRGVKMHMRMIHKDKKALYIAFCKSLALSNKKNTGFRFSDFDSVQELTTQHQIQRPQNTMSVELEELVSGEAEEDIDNNERSHRTKAGKKSLRCPVCKRCFPKIRGLKIHMRKAHRDKQALYVAFCKSREASKKKNTGSEKVLIKLDKFQTPQSMTNEELEEQVIGEAEANSSSEEDDEKSYTTHAIKKSFSCPVCKKCFPQVRGLKIHMRMVHKDKEAAYIAFCKSLAAPQNTSDELEERASGEAESSGSRSEEDNEESHNSKPATNSLFCPVCLKRFPKIRGLKIHMRKVHKDNEALYSALCKSVAKSRQQALLQPDVTLRKPISCATCFQRFKSQSNLDMHMREHAKDEMRSFSEVKSVQGHETNHTKKQNGCFKCNECGVKFLKEAGFLRHMKSTHSVDRPFKCSFCKKCSTTSSALRLHMLVHTGEKPHKCSVCRKCYTYKKALVHHMLRHTGESPVTCTDCGRKYKSEQWLKGHICEKVEQSANSDEQESGEESENRSDLNEHLGTNNDDSQPFRSETSTKSFKCPFCKKRFHQSKGLKLHMRVVHANQNHRNSINTGKFSCKVCDRRFITIQTLKEHTKHHTSDDPFRCSQCSLMFTKEVHFIQHMKNIHSIDKPFQCKFCHHRVKKSSLYRIHLRVHTGEKSYKCPQCGKGFTQRGNVTRHLLTKSCKKLKMAVR